MKRRNLMSIAPVLGALLALGAAAPSPVMARESDAAATKTDLRCAVVLFTALGSGTMDKQQATVGAFYFLGRLDGRAPNLDLQAAFTAELNDMSGDDMKRQALICGKILGDRGKSLMTLGEAMQKP